MAQTGLAGSHQETSAGWSIIPGDDVVWKKLRREAEGALKAEPTLSALLYAAILDRASLEEAVAYRLALRLESDMLPSELLSATFLRILEADLSIGLAFRADLMAVVERDPASGRLLDPFLFFKGFAAIQTHRFAHWLWSHGRIDLALLLQSRASELFQTDIHPAATFGRGIFIDHATGVVIGSTAVLEDDVSLLQNVTLGGSGVTKGARRHPTIRTGVMIGAGAKVLGAVEIGAYSKVAAGSVVTIDVPEHATAVGVPVRIIVGTAPENPAKAMDQSIDEAAYNGFTYMI